VVEAVLANTQEEQGAVRQLQLLHLHLLWLLLLLLLQQLLHL
jgi:hypothetical protein